MHSGSRSITFLWACVLLASSGSGKLVVREIASPQEQKAFTGRQLYEAIKHWGNDRNLALAFLESTYADRIDETKTPDRAALGAIFVLFMDKNRDKWDKPIEELIVEALRNAPAQIEAQKKYWAVAHAAAEAYFAQPTPENANKFLMALPAERQPMIDPDGEDRLREYVLDFFHGGRKNFKVLDKKLEQADPLAWDICYRLLNISDGAYSEIILYRLGTWITINPRLFLQKVTEHQPRSLDYLDNMLMMVAEFGEIPEAGGDSAKYEEISTSRIHQRIKALESVDDKDLLELRNLCITKLREGLKNRGLE